MGKKLIKSKIKLTIGMLVSNHIQYIRNSMEALKPLLEAVPSELIVVDTKGEETDGSIAIVREYTDKIYPFTWCDDFSAARNVCMQYAKGEWFLYVDDDEWFDDVTEFIEFFQSGECEHYQSGYYYTHDYSSENNYSVAIAGRMIRRREDTCFVGRVHETFNEVYGPNKQFQCFTHHYGYMFQNSKIAKKHQERNVSILEKELLEVGYTPRICAQMVQELLYLDDTSEKGFHFALEALKHLKTANLLKDSCSQWIIAATVRYFFRKNDLQGAKKQLQYVKENYSLSEMTQLVIAGTMANLSYCMDDIPGALDYVSWYLKQWDWKQSHETEVLVQVNLDFPKFFETSYYYKIIHMGAAVANSLGKYEQAKLFWDRLPWKEEGFDSSNYQNDFQTTMQGFYKQKKEEKYAALTKFDISLKTQVFDDSMYCSDDGTEEVKEKKQKQNINRLRKEIQEKGWNANLVAQMVQELLSNDETIKDGYKFCMDGISILKQRGQIMDAYSQWLLVTSVRCFANRNQYRSLLEQADMIQKNYPLSQIAKLVLSAVIILSAFEQKDYDTVLNYVSIYLENYDWRQANEEEALLQVQLDFPKFYTEDYYLYIVYLGATAANAKQAYEVANQYWKRIPWKREGFDGKEYAKEMNLTIRGLKRQQEKQKKADKAKELLSLSELLEQAGQIVCEFLRQGAIDTAIQYLIQMQETAITLGTEIDLLLGEGSKEVELLEAYCEKVWQASNSETVEGAVERVQEAMELARTVKEYIVKDTKEKKTVVFLPYKASMWDSLESVWRAAKEDEECNAYVIPIPYYDRFPDGSFGERHYEINDYPKDVPVIKYEDFDFEIERPDTIFIHNPYDKNNFVTSVHPFFYSENLKNFTKQLVYIPYFVLGENINTEDEEQVNHLKPMIVSAGVIHADKVIVQSEKMKQIYLEILTKVLELTPEARKEFEDKIFGLGSPKFDKVAKTGREDVEIPEEWLPILLDSNGEQKKIILYNISVTSILKYEELELDKIERVLKTFEENKEQVALLFRPHPLMKATIESMHPELWKRYKGIIKKYREEGWGIYDDTPDLNRALAISDAYYGDSSSLVQLCQEKGMPVMIQNVEVE